jgi:hypothetical protein
MLPKILSIAVLSSFLYQGAYAEEAESATISKVQYSESISEEAKEVLFLENMNQALALVNNESDEFTVSLESNFYPDFLLKVALSDGTEMSIDIVTPRNWTDNGTEMKEVSSLAEEIKDKVNNHLQAARVEGILVSSSGSKFDVRCLKNHICSIDSDGYLTIDDHRILYSKSEPWILEAKSIRSYGIMLLIEDGDAIYITDRNASMRPDRVGMQITCQTEIFEDQEYYPFTRPVLTDDNARNCM